ncbi:hypothetical protein FRX31_033867 [Thalictrum thalictroides]|uniref:AIPP2-like SPOC-like domain-containing protein n=1 Tax=Thalictrum thalictroides TaxID=46969 RepID=A0A7J6UVE7_THATH|nr:hypothetical protein FRX31_033867 [Thalictrum thalictroides]
MQENLSSGRPCDICGGIGNDMLIAVCSICHRSREHIYCMRHNLEEVPESWDCEACHAEMQQDPSKNQKTLVNDSSKVSDASKSISDKIRRRVLSRSFVPKKVETGKVRFLALDEIYSHPPGAKPKLSFFPVGPRSQLRTLGSHHRRIPNTISVATSPKSFVKKEHACKSPTQPKALPVSRVQTSTLQKQSVKPFHPLSGLKKSPSHYPSKSSTSEDLESVAALTKREKSHINGVHCSSMDHIGPAVTKCVRGKRQFGETNSEFDNCTGKVNSVLSKENLGKKEPLNYAAPCDKSGSLNSKFKFGEEDFPNPPAANASWKGCFKTLAFPHKVHVQAYPPGKLSRKAYLVSKQMPELLMFTLQPRCNVWPSPFNNVSPSGFDIALYFWAESFSREKYDHLVELMDKEDLSMQTRLNDTELLIFTSRHLPVEAQRMSKQFYLWGVFQWKSSVDFEENKHADHFPKIECRITEDSMTADLEVDDHVVDMEIDMVGGIEVGSACSNSSNMPSHDVFGRILSPHPIQQTAVPTHLHPVKKEHSDGYDAPPGFLRPVLAPYESDAPPGFLRPAHSPGLDAPPGILIPVLAPYESDAPPGFLRPVHSPCLDAPPSSCKFRDSSAKRESIATISTGEKGGDLPQNSVHASQKNHDGSGSKVGEVMHGAKYQTCDNFKGKAKLQQDEKLVYIEQKKSFPRTPTKSYY